MKKFFPFILILILIFAIICLASCSSKSGDDINGTYRSEIFSNGSSYFDNQNTYYVYEITLNGISFTIKKCMVEISTLYDKKIVKNKTNEYDVLSGTIEFNSKTNNGYFICKNGNYSNIPYKFTITDNSSMIVEFDTIYNSNTRYQNEWGQYSHIANLTKL